MRASQVTVTEELAFVAALREKDEADVLAEAVREGIRVLYQDALIEAYLLDRIPRQRMLDELGPERVDEIECRRDALKKDLAWGLLDE